MSAALSLKPSYYEALKRLTLELAGVNLGGNHEFLIETRLSALARQEGYDNLQMMIEELFASGQTRLAVHVVSALLERDTQFNDDAESLDDILGTVLPVLHRLYKGSTLRILSYGCSSGQEPYSLAMAIEKNKDLFPGLKYEITAVDYPSVAIDRARAGRYTHFDVQRGLPIADLIRFFDRAGEDWIIKDSLKDKVEFKDFHLLSNLDALGEFHLVVFRNRLAHYSAPAQIRVLRELASTVRELGFLALGRGEGVSHLNFGLDPVKGLPHMLRKREVIIEEEVDPNIKVPNGRTTFEGAKRRFNRARTELSDTRPEVETTESTDNKDARSEGETNVA
jgi:chemotaxis protein methyltransferase CheR